MTFRDPKLQQHCERTAAVAKDFPSEQVSVISLLDAWHWFHLAEGQDSSRAAEAIELLLSPELRPALRKWYRDAGDAMNENALQFRDRLSQLAGERFG